MAGEQDRFLHRVESPGVVEQLNSVNAKVNRKKENQESPGRHRRRPPSVEQRLEDEKEKQQRDGDIDNGHIDIHA